MSPDTEMQMKYDSASGVPVQDTSDRLGTTAVEAILSSDFWPCSAHIALACFLIPNITVAFLSSNRFVQVGVEMSQTRRIFTRCASTRLDLVPY